MRDRPSGSTDAGQEWPGPHRRLANQRVLSLAYLPDVAYGSLAIKDDPLRAAVMTVRANLVGVITNGTAVVGLSNIGPLEGKPMMEGNGYLFRKFASVNVPDIDAGAPFVSELALSENQSRKIRSLCGHADP